MPVTAVIAPDAFTTNAFDVPAVSVPSKSALPEAVRLPANAFVAPTVKRVVPVES